ncbi:MAG: hypothetical protein JWO22_2954 [Frankiales bacterium]|nr:hypothetical protein [Frankiales bacterium]
MRFTVQHPMAHAGYDPALLEPDAVGRLVTTAEACGFDAFAFTEHPAPSDKWLRSGGHDTLDPMAALAFCAALTSRIRLLTYLLVAPYRNPLLSAKELATVDLLSGGRLTVGLGAGYLRSEFAALGVDFNERAALLDEAVEVWRGVWSTDSFSYEGRHFTAAGQTARPRPVQHPHPPLWIGGNSRRARERVVAYGSGWTPLLVDGQVSDTIGTAALSTPADLAVAVDELRASLAAAGRDMVDVQVEWGRTNRMSADPAQARDLVDELAAAGATWVVVTPAQGSLEEALTSIEAYAENVVRR